MNQLINDQVGWLAAEALQWLCGKLLMPTPGTAGTAGSCGGTVCPRSSDPFYTVSYYMKWITTSWTSSSFFMVQRGYILCKPRNPKNMYLEAYSPVL